MFELETLFKGFKFNSTLTNITLIIHVLLSLEFSSSKVYYVDRHNLDKTKSRGYRVPPKSVRSSSHPYLSKQPDQNL